MDNKTCTVSGCGRRRVNDKEAFWHKFPTRRLIGLKWVQATGNADLQKLPYETITYKRFLVCWSHFVDKDFCKSQTGAMRLQRDADPTLGLPVQNVVLNESAGEIDLPDVPHVPSPSTPS
ncbi:THAP domain-containing protein 1-like [Belonocnema kinseyi]|uniref:THAP domain-containing protein 1-like n=1 Tax=Belonocnema kinseyi TaxID=2817044 RepID=UPI00143D62E2|nr:THAP domain-containing protein 1-like [Belonocnema kinseyi]